MAEAHDYSAHIIWEGNKGQGTATYSGYGREYRVLVSGKPDLAGSADPMFRGDSARHNPEDLFVAAISGCHLLSYLALCARQGVRVLSYEDEARGRLKLDADGGGRFEEVRLHPHVTIQGQGEENRALALKLHEEAHRLCFIANSCSVPIRHEATVDFA